MSFTRTVCLTVGVLHLPVLFVLADPSATNRPSVTNSVPSVMVLGGVQRPGAYEWRQGHHLILAIAQAGGLTPLADPSKVTIQRGGTNIFADATQIARGTAPRLNIQPGDQITVATRPAWHLLQYIRPSDSPYQHWTPEEVERWEKSTGERFPGKQTLRPTTGSKATSGSASSVDPKVPEP